VNAEFSSETRHVDGIRGQQTASRERGGSLYARQIVDLWTDGGCAPTNPGPGTAAGGPGRRLKGDGP
jgi:hypothetical protein